MAFLFHNKQTAGLRQLLPLACRHPIYLRLLHQGPHVPHHRLTAARATHRTRRAHRKAQRLGPLLRRQRREAADGLLQQRLLLLHARRAQGAGHLEDGQRLQLRAGPLKRGRLLHHEARHLLRWAPEELLQAVRHAQELKSHSEPKS